MADQTVVWNGEQAELAAALAERLHLRLVDQWLDDTTQLYLFYRNDCLSLGLSPAARELPVCVDFAEQQRHRQRGKELLLKAIGGRRAGLKIVDATAGLGRDSFLLASYGATVNLCERHPVVAAMLEDGLLRGRQSREVSDIVARMTLHKQSAIDYLTALSDKDAAEIIYLDPMFPDSGKTALVKKEMRLFHGLVGRDEDGDGLLEIALQKATHRVVVKRPPKAPVLAGPAPQFAVLGKAVRFDVYPLKAFKSLSAD